MTTDTNTEGKMGNDTITYRMELANKISGGRCVGNLYGVARYNNGCRAGWELKPQNSKDQALAITAKMNDEEGTR